MRGYVSGFASLYTTYNLRVDYSYRFQRHTKQAKLGDQCQVSISVLLTEFVNWRHVLNWVPLDSQGG